MIRLSHFISYLSVVLFVVLGGGVLCLMSQSTAMVVSRWSVNLTTHFLGKLRPKRLTCTYRVGQLLVTVERIVHIFSPVTNNCPT